MRTIFSKEILLLLVSSLIAVYTAEIFVRYSHNAWPFQKELVRLPYLGPQDEPLRWRFSSQGKLNSLGLKNGEIGKKTEDCYRIVILGDSLVWQGETGSGALYTEVVEKNLNEQLNLTDKNIEVINAGVPGYTTYQELEFLKIYGLDMEPDLIILGFVFNDVYYKYLHRPTADKLLDLEPAVLLNRFDTSSFPGVLFARSYLAHDVYFALGRIAKKMDRVIRGDGGYPWYPFEHRDDFYLAWKDYGWRNTARLVGEMRQLLDRKSVKFVAVVFPVVTQTDDSYRSLGEEYLFHPQRTIGSILDENAIPYLDLTETLYTGGGPNLFRDYVHLNDVGNEVVAEKLTRYLIDNKSAWLNVSPD